MTESSITGFFINTNKTSDIDKEWDDRGYPISWEHKTLLRWLIKLRNWQEKYNPILRPTRWTELTTRELDHIRSHEVLREIIPCCFLFRDKVAAHLDWQSHPVTTGAMHKIWERLLIHFEDVLDKRGERTKNGSKLRFFKGYSSDGRLSGLCFPLHSLRVSLLTALALDGGASISVLMKLAGHARLIMAIYYQKIGPVKMGKILEDARAKMLEVADESVQTFLMEQSLEELVHKVVCFDPSCLKSGLPEAVEDRSAAGWLRVPGGWCMMGGNISQNNNRHTTGGCFNGGQIIREHVDMPVRSPVPPRNCFGGGCRWAITRPEYLPELQAKVNNLFYHLHDTTRLHDQYETQLNEIYLLQAEAENEHKPFTELDRKRQLVSLMEGSGSKMKQLLDQIRNVLVVIGRCQRLLENRRGDELVALGSIADIKIAVNTTDSELLQLSGICQDAEIYPDLDPGDAVVRRSQLLDKLLFIKEFSRPVLIMLDKETQLKLGNRVMVRLAETAEPGDVNKGMELICGAIENGREFTAELKSALHSAIGEKECSTKVSALLASSQLLLQNENKPKT